MLCRRAGSVGVGETARVVCVARFGECPRTRAPALPRPFFHPRKSNDSVHVAGSHGLDRPSHRRSLIGPKRR